MPKFLDTVPVMKPKRSSFDLSNRYKFTAKFAQLIPAVCIPTLPSDHFNLGASFQARLSAMVNPIYDDIKARIEWFFVPNEIIFPDWKAFMTGDSQNNMSSTQSPKLLSVPKIAWLRAQRADNGKDVLGEYIINNYFTNETSPRAAYDVAVEQGRVAIDGSLADYLGIGLAPQDAVDNQSKVDTGVHSFNALPFLAYQSIYENYYLYEPVDTGEYTLAKYWADTVFDSQFLNDMSDFRRSNLFCNVRNRAWNRDIFTSATPSPVGDAAVNVDTSSGTFTIPQLNLARDLLSLIHI